jgi:release factor glutamine methyltransferase
MPRNSLTIKVLLAKAVQTLEKQKTPELDAELLLSHTLKQTREHLFSYPEKTVNLKQAETFENLIKKRKAGWPLAYLCGHKSFYGNNFIVNENVLIPRPETELLLETALSEAIKGKAQTIIDIGTGSGCIIISLLKKLYEQKPALAARNEFLAGDISREALLIAKKNARLNNVADKIKFYQGNLLLPIINKLKKNSKPIIITANLPYLTPKQIKNSPSIKKEPLLALTAGQDGLKYYRALFVQLRELQTHREKTLQIKGFFEIDPSQKNKITRLAAGDFTAKKIEIKKDLKGHNRLLTIEI